MTHSSTDQFAALYDATYSDVLRYVRRRADPLLVDDIVSETFAIAWRRRSSIPENARPWLFRTAANVVANATRGQRRQLQIAIRIGDGGGIRAEADIEFDLIAAWRSLSRLDQEVLALHIWEDLAAPEAAIVLGCSRATYAMRLTRARRRLGALLTETELTWSATQRTPREGTS